MSLLCVVVVVDITRYTLLMYLRVQVEINSKLIY